VLVTEVSHARRATAMSPRAKRRVMIGLAVWLVLAMAVGGGYAWLHRHDTICSDGKPPKSQLDLGLGQIHYRCQNGEIVKK
jgi:hypothetical protein